MLLFDLALKSLRNRAFSTSLTVGSIALSVALLIGVENVRVGMRESFSNTISQTDLIVGAKGGTIQLLLYSVFGMGSPTNNLSWDTYREWAEHPAIEWTIPYGLGDSPGDSGSSAPTRTSIAVTGTAGDRRSRWPRPRRLGGLRRHPGRGCGGRTGLRAGRPGCGDPRDRRGGLPEPRRDAVHGDGHPRQDVHAGRPRSLRHPRGHRGHPLSDGRTARRPCPAKSKRARTCSRWRRSRSPR